MKAKKRPQASLSENKLVQLPENTRKILEIPRHGEEEELRFQSETYFDWCEKRAEAIYEVDKLKDMLEERKDLLEEKIADISFQMRENPGKFGLKKVTDKAVEAAVLLEEIVKELKHRLNKLKHKLAKAKRWMNLCSAVCGALEHKKECLGKLANISISALGPDPETYRRQREKILGKEVSRESFYADLSKKNSKKTKEVS